MMTTESEPVNAVDFTNGNAMQEPHQPHRRRSSVTTAAALAHEQLHDFQEKYSLLDPGNHPASHFEPHMSPTRFKIRSWLAKYMSTQSPSLAKWQRRHRTTLRDIYFSYTSLLGSHTFYVLCLPTPVFWGYFEQTKDMVYIFGWTIYWTGFIKDYLCLPRPRSPPVHRIALSEYTTKEYGAPSSHTANAVGVSLYGLYQLIKTPTGSWLGTSASVAGIGLYCASMVVGRVYCGMHGLVDLISGALVGVTCFAVRLAMKSISSKAGIGLDAGVAHWWAPIVSITWNLYLLLYAQPEPVDECPCFDDSVAFVGVISGVECCEWFIRWFGFQLAFGYQKGSPWTMVMKRLAVGVPLVVLWKYVVSKPLVSFILLKVLRLKDDKLETQEERDKSKDTDGAVVTECPPYKPRSRINILTRFFVYAGIPAAVLLVSPPIVHLLTGKV